MIAVIDYNRGNIASVYNALIHLGYNASIVRDPKELFYASKVILPGVGAFGDGMEQLEKTGFAEVIPDIIKKGFPFLGICLGLQLLFESSEENPEVPGLSIFKGRVEKFKGNLKIPHMGWNQVDFVNQGSNLIKEVKNHNYFYFVHSFMIKDCEKSIILGKTNYYSTFVSAVEKDNVAAFQFHPEKSQETGLKLLKNWVESC